MSTLTVDVVSNTSKFSKGLKVAAAGLAAFAAGAVVAVNKASDLNESVNKTGEVFGKGTGDILKWSKQAAESLGQSQREALDAAANMGLFAQAAGLSGKATNKFAKEMVGLSSDLASFFNTKPAEAMEAIRAGLAGQSEPLRRYGVFLTEAAVAQEAVRIGLVKQNQELTEGQKVLARQSLILAQTGKAQGDFARTADGLANSTRIAAAQFEDLQAKLGTVLLPLFKLIVEGAMAVVDFIETHWKDAWAAVKETFTNAWNAVKPFAQAIGSVLIPLFQTMWNTIKDRLLPVLERIKPLLILIGAAIVLFATVVLAQFALVVTAISFLIDKFLDLVGFIRDKVVEPVVNFLRRIVEFIGKIIGVVKGPLIEAWNAIVGPIKRVIDSVIGWIKDLIGWIQDAIDLLARLKPGPDFTSEQLAPIRGVLEQNIPGAQHGGIVRRSGLAVVHKGEVFSGVNNEMGFGGINGDIVLQVDGQTFARITRDQLLKLQKRNSSTGL